MAFDSNTWKPPVLFHFQVEFQWSGNKASASFAEVDGLEHELVFDGNVESAKIEFPKSIKTRHVILKRALEPIDEKVTVWVKNTFRFMYSGSIKPCNMTVSLLDEKNNIIASWICMRSIPVKWSLNSLNAAESKIAIETITLKYEEIRRSK
ncbi:MAG: phage tail protein [Prevotella sp.]|jgi:phage tail-like protein|nr:phage tail protein [Prevotella sp.]MCH4182499.1 phage tail protein [Prevotella sp.]MCH4211631.1 phage tail protein [Prevotella sp.]MCH4240859.1 phage tail protein [Prevotella sp.]